MDWTPNLSSILDNILAALILLLLPWIARKIWVGLLHLNDKWSAASLQREIAMLERFKQPGEEVRYIARSALWCLASAGAAAMSVPMLAMRDGAQFGTAIWLIAGAFIYWISIRALANTSSRRADVKELHVRLALVQQRLDERRKQASRSARPSSQ